MNQPASIRRRRGLTLVELLAVIAIIGLLVGLLMPALQSARESSRRTTCTSNIKTLSMASLSHLEHIGMFPSGGSTGAGGTNAFSIDGRNGFAEEQGGGFLFNILPFMELESLRNLGGAAKQRAPLVIGCPTTLAPGSVALGPAPGRRPLGIACYSGAYGSAEGTGHSRNPDYRGTAPDGRIVQTAWSLVAPNAVYLKDLSKAEREATYSSFVNYGHRTGSTFNTRFNNGVICTFGRVRAAHVTDGLGNTLLCGEKPVRSPSVYEWAGADNPCDWASDNGGGWTAGWGWGAPSGGRPPHKYIPGFPYNAGGGCSLGGFGSRHDTTFGTAFCDGSVRHLGFEVDALTVWPQLNSRNDGQILNLPW